MAGAVQGTNNSIECRCEAVFELWGVAADDYVEGHLVRTEVTEGGHETLFRCPQSGRVWVQYVEPDDTGVPTLRLRWISEAHRPAAVIERLSGLPDFEQRIPYFDPDIEFQPWGSDQTYRGIAAARRFARKAASDPTFPRPAAISVVEKGDDAIVMGSVAVSRDGAYVEHRPAAWRVTVRDGKLVRIVSYDNWTEAREAAGVSAEEASSARRLGTGFLAMLGRSIRPAPGM
jgi:ketosteroid isomerase-like protein